MVRGRRRGDASPVVSHGRQQTTPSVTAPATPPLLTTEDIARSLCAREGNDPDLMVVLACPYTIPTPQGPVFQVPRTQQPLWKMWWQVAEHVKELMSRNAEPD